jgi:hypothetical protein
MAIKVRVLRSVQAGLTGMSGLVALSSGVSACTAEEAPGDSFEADESALTVANAGTGVLSLGWDYARPGAGFAFTSKNSTDEFVRAGEKLSFSLPVYYLWQRLYPNDPAPADLTRLKRLGAKVTATFVKDGATTSTTAATNGFSGTQFYDLAALTGQISVNKKAQSVRFEITITDAADRTKTAKIAATELQELFVIGGALPNKTALFDNNGGALRQRILEGGNPVAGANLAIGYTDWRAATLVDSTGIDRTIGNATSHGRFGAFQMAIQGDLEYEVSFAASVDGAWQPEAALKPNAQSRLLPGAGARTAYEGLLALPAGAQKLEVYFHVKTFLVVNYDKFSDVGWRKYTNGDRILIREKWDNKDGVYAQNYAFPTEAK